MKHAQIKFIGKDKSQHKRLESHGRLIYRPQPSFKRAIGGASPMLFGRLPSGEFTTLGIGGSTFDGKPIDRKLAKSLTEGRLIAWGPVPTGQSSGKYPLYADGVIWIAEETAGASRFLVISDRRTDRKEGNRNGYLVALRCKTTNSVSSSENRGMRTELRTEFYGDVNFLSGTRSSRLDKGKANAALTTFTKIGEEVLWVRYKRRTHAPSIFRGGRKFIDSTGAVLLNHVEDLDLPFVPYSSSAAQNFGHSVETYMTKWLATPVQQEMNKAAVLAAVFTIAAGATFSIPPAAGVFGVVAGSFGLWTVILSMVGNYLTGTVIPAVWHSAEQAYDWYYPPAASPTSPSTSPAYGLNSILDDQPAIEEGGYGQSELWDIMNESNESGSEGPGLDWPPQRDPGNPPPDPIPWPTPDPEPDPDDGGEDGGEDGSEDGGDDGDGPPVSAYSASSIGSVLIIRSLSAGPTSKK